MKTYDEVQAVAKAVWELDVDTHWWADYTANDDVKCVVECNDFFWWGSADGEDLEASDLPVLRDAHSKLKATEDEGCTGLLYCAMKRKMRPQGACYDDLPPETWHLFDACGPKREVGIGNPVAHPNDRAL